MMSSSSHDDAQVHPEIGGPSRRRKSSVLISPELDALPMRTKLIFFFDPRPLFKNGSGRKALVFEMYQLPLTAVQCGLCFVVLAVNYFYRPMVTTIEVGMHEVADTPL